MKNANSYIRHWILLSALVCVQAVTFRASGNDVTFTLDLQNVGTNAYYQGGFIAVYFTQNGSYDGAYYNLGAGYWGSGGSFPIAPGATTTFTLPGQRWPSGANGMYQVLTWTGGPGTSNWTNGTVI